MVRNAGGTVPVNVWSRSTGVSLSTIRIYGITGTLHSVFRIRKR